MCDGCTELRGRLDRATDAFARITLRYNVELEQLLAEKRELQFRLTDLSQRELNVIGVLEEWEPVFADVPELKETITRIRAALKMGDD